MFLGVIEMKHWAKIGLIKTLNVHFSSMFHWAKIGSKTFTCSKLRIATEKGVKHV